MEFGIPKKLVNLMKVTLQDSKGVTVYSTSLSAVLDDVETNVCTTVNIESVRWAGHVTRMGEDRGVHRVLVGKPEGKRPLGRRRRRWEDNIKMDLQDVGGGGVDWMELAQDKDRWRALVNTVMNFRVR